MIVVRVEEMEKVDPSHRKYVAEKLTELIKRGEESDNYGYCIVRLDEGYYQFRLTSIKKFHSDEGDSVECTFDFIHSWFDPERYKRSFDKDEKKLRKAVQRLYIRDIERLIRLHQSKVRIAEIGLEFDPENSVKEKLMHCKILDALFERQEELMREQEKD